jgi:hypothetical protein
MKIAYLIMLHNNFPQVRWIVDAIYNNEDILIIHVDKKADQSFSQHVAAYLGNRPNVKYLPRRHVNRFAWSMVEIELRAIKALLSLKDEWKYFINLSGEDYPIKSICSIKTKLRAAWPKNFVDVISFDAMTKLNPQDHHLARRLAFEMFGTVIRTPLRLPFPKRVDIKYKGSQWFMLSRDFCEWLVSSRVTSQIEKLIKYTWTPDELFFQALIMNSPYRNSLAEHYGREIIWSGNTASPKTLCMEDYERLSASPGLFARKFDESVDRQILLCLARDYGHKVPAR